MPVFAEYFKTSDTEITVIFDDALTETKVKTGLNTDRPDGKSGFFLSRDSAFHAVMADVGSDYRVIRENKQGSETRLFLCRSNQAAAAL
jgi:hypothetical protein